MTNHPKTITRLVRSLTLAIACLVTAPVAANAAEFAVVVNAGNQYSGGESDAKEMVKQLFLKNRSRWPGNTEAKPLGRRADSPPHKAFLEKVLKMSEAQLAQHWLSLKQKTGQTPPRAIGSDKMLIKMVAKYQGGFSVVSKEAADGAGNKVKVLFTFNH